MVYGYIRVSTDLQDVRNQTIGINSKAKELGVVVNKWISDDGVSGAKEPEDRLLGPLLKKLQPNDVIITSEISRLGRKLYMIMRILEGCMKAGAKVITVKDGYELGDNIQSKVLAFAFGLAAEIERDMISKRTKEGLARVRSEGKILGRPVGSKKKNPVLLEHLDRIKKMIEENRSQVFMSKKLKCHRHTIKKFLIEKKLS